MMQEILLSGVNAAYPNAIIYSSNDSFWNWLLSWWNSAFNTFKDTFMYYAFWSVSIEVIWRFIAFFALMLAVAYVSSLIFGWWFWTRFWFESKVKSLISKKK